MNTKPDAPRSLPRSLTDKRAALARPVVGVRADAACVVLFDRSTPIDVLDVIADTLIAMDAPSTIGDTVPDGSALTDLLDAIGDDTTGEDGGVWA